MKYLAFFLINFFSIQAFAAGDTNWYSAGSLFGDKYVIKGYDTVAYFTDNKAVKGSKNFSFKYQGGTFLFKSKENLELFTANPEKYVPQYGGWCAYAAAQDPAILAKIDPEIFTIVDGKLYLNYSRKVNDKWVKDIPGYIKKADKNWPKLNIKN